MTRSEGNKILSSFEFSRRNIVEQTLCLFDDFHR